MNKKIILFFIFSILLGGTIFGLTINHKVDVDLFGNSIFNATEVNSTNGNFVDITTTDISIDTITTTDSGVITSDASCDVLIQGTGSEICLG